LSQDFCISDSSLTIASFSLVFAAGAAMAVFVAGAACGEGSELAAPLSPPLAASTTLKLFCSSIFCIRSTASFSARGKSGAGSPNFVPARNPPHAISVKKACLAASAISPCPSCRHTFAADSGKIG
jgi:hypothetical protein